MDLGMVEVEASAGGGNSCLFTNRLDLVVVLLRLVAPYATCKAQTCHP